MGRPVKACCSHAVTSRVWVCRPGCVFITGEESTDNSDTHIVCCDETVRSVVKQGVSGPREGISSANLYASFVGNRRAERRGCSCPPPSFLFLPGRLRRFCPFRQNLRTAIEYSTLHVHWPGAQKLKGRIVSARRPTLGGRVCRCVDFFSVLPRKGARECA